MAAVRILLEEEKDERWLSCLEALRAPGADRPALCRMLSDLRRSWTGALNPKDDGATTSVVGPGCLLAAAHYELAAYAVIRAQVATVKSAITARPAPRLEPGETVVAEVRAKG